MSSCRHCRQCLRSQRGGMTARRRRGSHGNQRRFRAWWLPREIQIKRRLRGDVKRRDEGRDSQGLMFFKRWDPELLAQLKRGYGVCGTQPRGLGSLRIQAGQGTRPQPKADSSHYPPGLLGGAALVWRQRAS